MLGSSYICFSPQTTAYLCLPISTYINISHANIYPCGGIRASLNSSGNNLCLPFPGGISERASVYTRDPHIRLMVEGHLWDTDVLVSAGLRRYSSCVPTTSQERMFYCSLGAETSKQRKLVLCFSSELSTDAILQNMHPPPAP